MSREMRRQRLPGPAHGPARADLVGTGRGQPAPGLVGIGLGLLELQTFEQLVRIGAYVGHLGSSIRSASSGQTRSGHAAAYRRRSAISVYTLSTVDPRHARGSPSCAQRLRKRQTSARISETSLASDDARSFAITSNDSASAVDFATVKKTMTAKTANVTKKKVFWSDRVGFSVGHPVITTLDLPLATVKGSLLDRG